MNVFLLNVSVQLTDLDLFHELGSERLTHGDAHRSKLQQHITQQHMQLYVQQHNICNYTCNNTAELYHLSTACLILNSGEEITPDV